MNKKLIEIAKCRKGIILMYLFGSMTHGKIGVLSDYDIAVLVDGKFPYSFRYYLHSELCKALNTGKVDLVVLNSAPSAPIELVYNIIATGKLLYERSVYDRVEFEANTLSEYFDWSYWLSKMRV